MNPETVEQPGWSVRVKALLSLGLLAGFGAVFTLAAWTGTATATSDISAATVFIAVGADENATNVSFTIPMATANWYPGMSQAALVTVKNTGTSNVSYAVQGATTGALGTAMAVGVSIGGTVQNGSATGGTCSVTPPVYSKSGGTIFPAASTHPLGNLDAGAWATFCVQAQLPLGAASTLQNQSTGITLTFTASTRP
ncbi:hypothetical protein SAMN04489740_1982 [Arthrobacter alpinus]|uniref:SipW-cognate class signal peptide n=1 Tax=Arthrobacter alpinus TaxID=656366 RepID=A0A1H5KFF7_9MICC|nr:hypothetical protein [Arthrobacter alpinus]SEE63294.1 hypothetical protein SAMN04489740_1982 [Arthrobacter alpinus]